MPPSLPCCSQAKKSQPLQRLPYILLAVLLIVPFLRAWTWATTPYSPRSHGFPTHLRIDALSFGVLLAYIYTFQPGIMRRISGLRWPVCLLGLLTLLTVLFIDTGKGTQYVVGLSLIYTAFGALLLAVMCGPGPAGPKPLALGVAACVGMNSYSIYLWHTVVLGFGPLLARKAGVPSLGYYGDFAVYMLGALLLGIAMAKCVEFPVLRVRDRFWPSRGR